MIKQLDTVQFEYLYFPKIILKMVKKNITRIFKILRVYAELTQTLFFKFFSLWVQWWCKNLKYPHQWLLSTRLCSIFLVFSCLYYHQMRFYTHQGFLFCVFLIKFCFFFKKIANNDKFSKLKKKSTQSWKKLSCIRELIFYDF